MSDDEQEDERRDDPSTGIPRVVYICASIELLVLLSESISAVPIVRMIEGAVCQRFYNLETNIAEHLCKGDEVQSNMAHLLGASASFESLPSLLLTIPYGILAERIDRRFILLMNYISGVVAMLFLIVICYNPASDIRLIWLYGVFDIVGGGSAVAQLLVRTMIAESVPSASLSTVLYRLSGLSTVIRLLGVSFGSWLIGGGAATALLIGQSVFFVVIPLLAFIPRPGATSQSHQYRPLPLEEELDEIGSSSRQEHAQDGKESLMASYRAIKRLALHNRAFSIGLLVFSLNALGMQGRSQLRPWMSKRYSWSLATTGYILSVESLFSGIILFLLQYFTTRSRYRAIEPSHKRLQELNIAASSLLCSIIGMFILGLAQSRAGFFFSACIFAAGVGFLDSVKAYFTASLAGGSDEGDVKRNIGRFYTAVLVVENTVIICSAPIWGVIYSWGYKLGGIWMGLVWFGGSAVLGATLMVVLRVRRSQTV